MTGLPPGSYVVRASASTCSVSPPAFLCNSYVPQYYDGVDDVTAATSVPVTGGGAVVGIDFALPAPSALHPLPLGGLTFTETRDTSGATLQPGEPRPCGNIGATVWYRLDVAASPEGYPTFSVDTVGSDFNTAVAVYKADGPGSTPLSGSTLLSCKADASQSMVVFTASTGSTYFFQVGGQGGATGTLKVNVSWDSAGDGYTDLMKTRLGATPSLYCGIMRADINEDGTANGLDLGMLAVAFTKAVPPASPRIDQNRDNKINGLDLGALALSFTKSVTLCP